MSLSYVTKPVAPFTSNVQNPINVEELTHDITINCNKFYRMAVIICELCVAVVRASVPTIQQSAEQVQVNCQQTTKAVSESTIGGA